jgi:hypothetical protein
MGSLFYRLWHWWLGLNGRDRATIILEVLGIAVVAAYTTVAAIQWHALKKANRINRMLAQAAKESADAEIATNRAWIVPSDGPQRNSGPVELYWTNAGKNPAVRVRGTAEYATQRPHHFLDGCDTLAKTMVIKSTETAKGRVAVSVPGEQVQTVMAASGGWWIEQPYLLSDRSFQMTLQEVPKDWNRPLVAQQTHVLLIHGCIWYTDALTHQERTTEFCYDATRSLSPITGTVENNLIFCPEPPEALVLR